MNANHLNMSTLGLPGRNHSVLYRVFALYRIHEFWRKGSGRATHHYKLSRDSGHRELSAEPVDRPEQWETRGKTDNWRLGCVIAPLSWAESSVSTVAADLFGLR